jgi:hypothetical protein
MSEYENALTEKKIKNRGFTEEELMNYLNAGNSYTNAAAHFGRSKGRIPVIVARYRRHQQYLANARNIPTDVRTMPLKDFAETGNFSGRTMGVLRIATHGKDYETYTVGDFIKDGNKLIPGAGCKTIAEIKRVLVKVHNISPSEFCPFALGFPNYEALCE